MTRQEKVNLLNELLEIEEKNDIGNLTRTDRREFQQWVEDLEQEHILDKPHIEGDYYDGFKNGSRTAEWKYDKMRVEIEQLKLHKAQFITNDNKVCIDSQEVLNVIDKYRLESEE